jgi:DNA-binding NarL/FixJ family response regulator
VHGAFRLGVAGYLIKSAAVAELVTAIREILAGRKFFCLELRQRFGDPDPMDGASGALFASNLTPRQREVLQLVVESKSAKEISTC